MLQASSVNINKTNDALWDTFCPIFNPTMLQICDQWCKLLICNRPNSKIKIEYYRHVNDFSCPCHMYVSATYKGWWYRPRPRLYTQSTLSPSNTFSVVFELSSHLCLVSALCLIVCCFFLGQTLLCIGTKFLAEHLELSPNSTTCIMESLQNSYAN